MEVERWKQSEHFCDCASEWLDQARPLAIPWLFGVVAWLLSIIVSVSGLCNALASCRRDATTVDVKSGTVSQDPAVPAMPSTDLAVAQVYD